MIIAVDFDGTVVKHEYPAVGECVGAVEILKELIRNGHILILLTMRSDQYLEDAVNWFKERNISLYDVNNNPTQKDWTNSRKVYAHLYIDDAALGVPLKQDRGDDRAYVDWVEVRRLLVKRRILPF